jgi:hypothetical protein
MKRLLLVFLLASMLVFGFGHIASAYTELITNGGFETGDFTGWTLSGEYSDVMVLNNLPPHSGTWYAYFSGDYGIAYITQDIATIPGAHYSLSFCLANGDPDHHVYSWNEFLLKWGNSTLADLVDMSEFDYLPSVIDVVAVSTTTALQFGIISNNSYMRLDDVSVVQTSSPVPLLCSSSAQVWSALSGLG